MANNFVHSLNVTVSAITSDEPIADVPCGSCTVCCELLSPYLTPDEISSGKYPISFVQGESGPVVVLYRNIRGGCAMLIDGKCSIYNNRPIACRQYDCRKGHHPSTNAIAKEKFGIDI